MVSTSPPVRRVLGQWTEIKEGGRFPHLDEIELWLLGEDGPNCLLISVQAARALKPAACLA